MKEIKLFDYQEEMKSRIVEAFKLHQSVMAQMPTGTGKTYLLTAVIDSFVKNNPNVKVWIVAHRRELVSQIEETVRKFYSYSASENASLLTSVKAMSIQWLSRHYDDVNEESGLIVIDEAHHALAKTYKEMWERYPKAKFLGLTATPCRLNGKGFTDLFDVLVQSWNIPEFISKGRLATYDFVSIKSDSFTQRLIDSLKKRGADGDYQNKEMDMLLNKRPSIRRLYQSFVDFAKDRKGIVYAINISHAKKITEQYQEHGINAIAIDSKTPAAERQRNIEAFKKGDIQVLVNVDIFSEGFDCPDVEFVQLARPTLSLAKYLQMVGRGLRIAKGKKNCVIIDNVGLYRVFGLPSQIWNWNAMFKGRMSKKKIQDFVGISIANTASLNQEKDGKAEHNVDSEMMMVVSHEQLNLTFEQQKKKNGWEQLVKSRVVNVGGMSIPTRDIEDMGFYSRYVCPYQFHMCRVLENDKAHIGGHCIIFLYDEPEEYYWLSGELHDGSLVVMSENYRYYWVENGKQKVNIGCAKNYEEERKMNERLAEIIKLTNLRESNKKQDADEENVTILKPCQIGSKWGLRDNENHVIVPPIYRNIRKENDFFVFELLFNHWGVMDGQGKVVIQPKFEKVKVTAEGMAILTNITGKTQTINLR